jgi:hypothetical protein
MAEVWHPAAVRIRHPDAGPMLKAPARGVLHTTETETLPDYAPGTAPHFTLHPHSRELWQHIPLNRAAQSLEHHGRLETNRMNAVQIEIIEHAAHSPDWSPTEFHNVAALMRWVEAADGVHRSCTVRFTDRWHPMPDEKWRNYDGWCGHQHVPGQTRGRHSDPGRLRVRELLNLRCEWTLELLRNGSHGAPVRILQRWINALGREHPGHYPKLRVDGRYGEATRNAVRTFQRRHQLNADGRVGPRTWRALCRTATR